MSAEPLGERALVQQGLGHRLGEAVAVLVAGDHLRLEGGVHGIGQLQLR